MKRYLVLIALILTSICRVESPATGSTRIGNFYYQASNGIAFIKDDAAAFVINPGGDDIAGTVAPDDSFHKTILTVAPKREIEFEWSRQGDAIVGRILSQKSGELTFKVGENWPGFMSRYSADGDGVQGAATLADGTTVNWSLRTQPAPKSVDGGGFTLSLHGVGHPIYMVAGFGKLPSLDGIDAKLVAAQAAYDARRPTAQGPTGDILAAIADNLNNSRIYSSDNKMVAISVSRTFNTYTPNTCPYFCWDSFFSGLLASLDDPAMGRQTVRAILSGMTSDGFVPNFCHWSTRNEGPVSLDRSQPPVGAMCVWKMNQYQPDADFLREVYPKLVIWHAWWMKARNAKNDGLLEWNGGLETGWDDTPTYKEKETPGVMSVGQVKNVYAVDLCSLWAMDAHYLALIADAIGKPQEAAEYRQEETDMNRRMNDKLWDEKLGIYCNRFWDKPDGAPGDFITRLTPANFYPMITGAPDAKRADRMLAIMTDPNQFWGEWILPTVSRQDPLYFQQRYWHGTIWGPVNYLVWQGVKRYGTPELKAEYAQKSVHLFMNNWLGSGECGENFLSLSGRVGGNPYYTWGALMCLVGVESVVDIGDDGTPVLGCGYNEPVEFSHFPIAGKPYHIVLHAGKPDVSIAPQ